MKFLSLTGGVILSCLALATTTAAKSNDRFTKLQTKSLSSAPLKLNDAAYSELTDVPRDFTSIVLLTALPAQYGCVLCKEFQPEWDILAKSWVKGDSKGASRVLFGTLDFPDGKGTFQKVRCENGAPSNS